MISDGKMIEGYLESARAVISSWEDYQNGEIHAAELTARVTQLEESCSGVKDLVEAIERCAAEVRIAQRFEREAMERYERVFAENTRIRALLFKLKLSDDPSVRTLGEDALKGALDAAYSQEDSRDAKRYRWLRQADFHSEPAVATADGAPLNGEELDQLLDAAISAAPANTFLRRMRR